MRYILPGLLCLGLLLRLAGVRFGLPLDLMGDEFVHVYTAFNFFNEMTARAVSPLSYTPSLLAVLLAPLFVILGGMGIIAGAFEGIAGFKEYAILHATDFLSISRVLSALFGVVFLYTLYMLVRRLVGYWPAIIVTVFAVFDFWFVHESIHGHFWMPATAFVALAFYLLIRLTEEGLWKYYIGSVISMVLGFWMAYFPIILAPFLLLAHVHTKKSNLLRLGAAFVLYAGLFVLIAWLNPVSFWLQFGRGIGSVFNAIGMSVAPGLQAMPAGTTDLFYNLVSLLQVVFFNNPPLMLLGMIGLGLMIFRPGFRSFIVQLTIGFFIIYLILVISVFSDPDHRYILPLLLPLYLGVGYVTQLLLECRRAHYGLYVSAIILLSLTMLYSVYTTTMYVLLLQKDDTRILAREWVLNNAKPDSVIYVDVPYLDLPKNREVIEFYGTYLPEALRTKDRTLALLSEERFPHPAYFFVEARYAPQLVSVGLRYDYLLVSFSDPQERIIPPGFDQVAVFTATASEKRRLNLLQGPYNPFQEVSIVERLGPNIEIYRRVE